MISSPSEPAPHFNERVLSFARRLRMNGERVHGTCKLTRQCRIYHAVALDPALPLEGLRHKIYPKVRLASRPVAGMALMQMGLVLNLEAFGKESFAQLICDSLSGRHKPGLELVAAFRQSSSPELNGFAMSRLEGFCVA